MADGSAAALVELLLADEGPESPTERRPSEALAEVLSADPPLLLWTVCVAGRSDALEPRSIDDAGRWLADQALAVLQWEPGPVTPSGATAASDAQRYAARISAGMQVADLAAQLAAEHGQPAAELAFLLGLLGDARGWLAMAGGPPAKDTATCLPEWLSRRGDTPALASVNLATEVLAGQASLPEGIEVDLDACRRRAVEGRRRWLAPVEGVADWLPRLSARLARLEALENRFQQSLQTEKLEAMAEFAAGAGHEINNPLAVISGRAQYFLEEEDDPERRHAWALMVAQTKRVYEMIADMMLFARPPQPELEMIDLVELLDHLVEDLSPRVALQETTLRRTGADGPVEIEADGTQLTVALQALCKNSLEAIGREGRIEISVQQGDGKVEIRVSDNGPGIPPEERRHLFDPYYSARQAGRGLGLGLSKCWRIVTNHGGRIDPDSQPGRGTVFTITLPRRLA